MGLLSQLGAKAETVYGTPVVVDRFYPVLSETLERNNRTMQSDAIRATGRSLRRDDARTLVGHEGAGELRLEVAPSLYGLWFTQALGAVDTSQPDAGGSPTVYEHLFTLGTLWNKSTTIQKGVEQEDGTVVPFTFAGCKITGWRLEISADGYLLFVPTIHAQSVQVDDSATPALALAAASYTAQRPLRFDQGAFKIEGTVVGALSGLSITGDNGLKTDRPQFNYTGLRRQPRQDGYPAVTGEANVEFIDKATIYDVYAADTAVELVLDFVGEAIDGSYDEQVTVTLPASHLEGDTPKIDGPSIPQLRVPFSAYDDDANESIEILLRNTDSAA